MICSSGVFKVTTFQCSNVPRRQCAIASGLLKFIHKVNDFCFYFSCHELSLISLHFFIFSPETMELRNLGTQELSNNRFNPLVHNLLIVCNSCTFHNIIFPVQVKSTFFGDDEFEEINHILAKHTACICGHINREG